MPKGSTVGGVDLPGLLGMLLMLVVVLFPLLLARPASPPANEEPPPDGDGGIGPRRSGPPLRPTGGIPLADAELGRWRLRDHAGSARRRERARRVITPHTPSPRSPSTR